MRFFCAIKYQDLKNAQFGSFFARIEVLWKKTANQKKKLYLMIVDRKKKFEKIQGRFFRWIQKIFEWNQKIGFHDV